MALLSTEVTLVFRLLMWYGLKTDRSQRPSGEHCQALSLALD